MVTKAKTPRIRRGGTIPIKFRRQEVESLSSITNFSDMRQDQRDAVANIIDTVKTAFPGVVKENVEGNLAEAIRGMWFISPIREDLNREMRAKVEVLNNQIRAIQDETEGILKQLLQTKLEQAGITNFVVSNNEYIESKERLDKIKAADEAYRVLHANDPPDSRSAAYRAERQRENDEREAKDKKAREDRLAIALADFAKFKRRRK